jgi:hypothetical protein
MGWLSHLATSWDLENTFELIYASPNKSSMKQRIWVDVFFWYLVKKYTDYSYLMKKPWL